MVFYKIYYQLKPFIPRLLQIQVRRQVVLLKRARYSDVWPIDDKAANPPEGWSGWPEQKQFALVLHHDVDTGKGHKKCDYLTELEEKMGFRSSFNFVPERYDVSSKLRSLLVEKGFEVGVHGLKHDGKLFLSKRRFLKQAGRINLYLKKWKSVGFVSPSMHQNLDWISELEIKHDSSTFDTDPFEPQPDGAGTIFPFWVQNGSSAQGFVELPYTLPQDFTLFVLMREKNIDIWKRKLDWIVEKGGMALLITHPDYMNCNQGRCTIEEYPMEFYEELLDYVKFKYEGQYWHPLPKDMAYFWKEKIVEKRGEGGNVSGNKL